MQILRTFLKVFDYVMEESWGILVNVCLASPHCNSMLIQMTVVTGVATKTLPLSSSAWTSWACATPNSHCFLHLLARSLILFGRLNPRSAAISRHGMFKAKWFKVCRTELNGPDCQEILQLAHFYSIYLYLNVVAALSLFIMSQNLFFSLRFDHICLTSLWTVLIDLLILHYLIMSYIFDTTAGCSVHLYRIKNDTYIS